MGKPLTVSAEGINLVEVGLSVSLRSGELELELRVQDDQPDTPDEKDIEAAIGVVWTLRF